MLLITKTTQAEEDLIDIWGNIAGDNIPAADKLLDRFEGLFSTLIELPEMGTVVKGLEKCWPGKINRFFPVDDYIIFYHITDKSVNIVRVIHASLDYTRVFRSH
jgi:toxin ParE1/3/4